MSRERVERILDGYSAFNRGDLDAGLEGISDEASWELLDVMPEQEALQGKEGIRAFWDSWTAVFAEFRAEIEEVVDAGEQVIAVMHMSGRARGTDAEMRTPTFAQIWTWQDERIVRVRMVPGKDEALALVAEDRAEANEPDAVEP
jgi:ketosteroid isomerase-like protein